MSAVVLASLGVFSSVPGILIVLIAATGLLYLRTWSATIGLNLTRLTSLSIDVVIALFVLLFVLFVIVRFETLA